MAMRPALAEADLVKQQGSHVLALGEGSAVTKALSARRLTAVSGFDEIPGSEFAQAERGAVAFGAYGDEFAVPCTRRRAMSSFQNLHAHSRARSR
jgi:hypothetical protein